MDKENMQGMQSQTNSSRLMAINELFYKMPAPLSVSVVTTHKKQYSTRNLYTPGQTIVFDINCNSAVDCDKSYLKFGVTATGAGSINWQTGSALNVIREVRIMSKNGAELDRINNFNVFARYFMRNCISVDEFEKYGALWGVNGGVVALNSTEYYVFPLKLISGLFRPHGNVKLPPALLSGARIELVLEDNDNAITGNPGTVYQLLNPEIQLSEHSLSDNALKVLTEESANNGLEITYPRVFVSSENVGLNSSFNTQIKKAVSQCTKIIVVPQPTVVINNINLDSFGSLFFGEFRKYQFRVGSSYFPNQEVTDVKEAYQLSSQVCDMHKIRPYVRYTEYTLNNNPDFSLAAQIKADDEISSSGLAINNSASLAVSIQTDPTSTTAKTYFMLMEYTALARVFLSQVSVKV